MKNYYIYIRRFWLLVVSCLVMVGCDNQDDSSLTNLLLAVNGENLEIGLTDDYVQPTSLNTEFPTQFKVSNIASFESVKINGEVVPPSGEIEIQLAELAKGKVLTVEFSAGGKVKIAVIRTLPVEVPSFECQGASATKGHYYMSFVYLPLVLKLDGSGNVVYYRFEPKGEEDEQKNNGFWDFKKHNINGTVYYSYHEADPKYADQIVNGYNPGARVLLDSKYTKIDRFQLEAKGDVRSGEPIDGHDFILIDRHHYIMASYVRKFVPDSAFPPSVAHKAGGCYVAATYLQEVYNHSVIFDWWSTDHSSLFALGDLAGFGTTTSFDFMNDKDQNPDYVHFNSMQIDVRDNSLICSFRHISTILKINREDGSIVWKLSGAGSDFPIDEARRSSGQHYARLHQDGTITCFDNQNSSKRTRITTFGITSEQTKQLTVTNRYVGIDYFSVACGSVMPTPDNPDMYVIGWGVSGSEGQSRVVSEVNMKTGEALFEMKLKAQKAEDKNIQSTYRTVKY